MGEQPLLHPERGKGGDMAGLFGFPDGLGLGGRGKKPIAMMRRHYLIRLAVDDQERQG